MSGQKAERAMTGMPEGAICLDVETTGLKAGDDEILTLSIASMDGEEVFRGTFKPQRKTEWPIAEKINGISPDDVADLEPIAGSLGEIQGIVDAAPAIYGYNVAFDAGFLRAAGVEIPQRKLRDTMMEYARVRAIQLGVADKRRVKLTVAAEAVGHSWGETGAHDSMEDVMATISVQRWCDSVPVDRGPAPAHGAIAAAASEAWPGIIPRGSSLLAADDSSAWLSFPDDPATAVARIEFDPAAGPRRVCETGEAAAESLEDLLHDCWRNCRRPDYLDPGAPPFEEIALSMGWEHASDRDPRGLGSIGARGVIDTALSVLGFAIARIGDPDRKGGLPTLALDPCIDREWESRLGSEAIEAAAGVFWERDSPGTPEGVLDLVREKLAEAIAAEAEDWRAEAVELLARGLAERYPELTGAGSPYSEPLDLAAEIEERLGLHVDTSKVGEIVGRCRSKVTLVIGTRPDFDDDWGPSRRVLRSAATWLDGPQTAPWDPEADPSISDDYAKCSVKWLCDTQGTSLAEVVNGRDGRFAESLRDAINEDVGDSWGWPMIGVLTTLDLNDIATANTALEWETPHGTEAPFSTVPTGTTAQGLPRQPAVVLTDPVNGRGQRVAIELDRPLDIALGNVCCAMPDGVGGKWGDWCTSREIGGWLPSEFERTMRKPAAHGIDEAPMPGRSMGMKLR